MKISVGIVGYGNLGKALEKELLKSEIFQLEAIFSRRKLEKCMPFDKILNYKDKIKLLFLCVGSQNDLEKVALSLINDFDIIESYDNHARLKAFHAKLDKIAKENCHVALCSVGWDPGLFSIMRGLFDSLGYEFCTFWGKGTSQGHTQAVKNICGVQDAIQFTVPDNVSLRKVKNGEKIENAKSLHKRLCFVTAKKENQDEIKQRIITMKDYFEGYKTTVKFVSQKKLDKIKSFSHKGEVTTYGNFANFSLNLPSNPQFTAKVLHTFAKSLLKFAGNGEFGVHTIFDVPIKFILNDNFYKFL